MLVAIISFSTCKKEVEEIPITHKVYESDLKKPTIEELHSFFVEGFTVINGDVELSKTVGLIDMFNLSNVDSINGNFIIYHNDELLSLDGLDNLKSIDGDLTITLHSLLESLTALNSVTSITGSIKISGNNRIKNFSGLENITSLGVNLQIGYNELIKDLHGLDNLHSVYGDVSINGYTGAIDNLVSFDGLNNLKLIGGDLSISILDKIKNLDAFINLHSLSGIPNIHHNSQLDDFCGISALIEGNYVDSILIYQNLYNPDKKNFLNGDCTEPLKIYPTDLINPTGQELLDFYLAGYNVVDGNVIIDENINLFSFYTLSNIIEIKGHFILKNIDDFLGSSSPFRLKSVDSSFQIINNSQLGAISSFWLLESIGGSFIISDNDRLCCFTKSDNLHSINGNLSIQNNSILMNFCGFQNITNINGDVTISDNLFNPTFEEIIAGNCRLSP